jgi:obg-like ATPase 1
VEREGGRLSEHQPDDHGQAGERERGGEGGKSRRWRDRVFCWFNRPTHTHTRLPPPSFPPSSQVVYLVNLSEKAYIKKKAKWLPKIFEWVAAHGGDPIIPFSGALESRIFDMPDDEKEKTLAELETTSALPKIITAGFKAVRLMYFFTAGEDEVKCWQVRRGCKAPQAAGTIHTDFERGFICAEVMHFDELKEAGSEGAVKAAGKYRQEGKNYTVEDGDVIFFKFNVTSTGKK